MSGARIAGAAFTVFDATGLEVESLLSAELREHAVRPANASNCRKANCGIEIER